MDFLSKAVKKMGKRALGVCLLLVGIVGLFMPFLQGIALIIAGLIMIDLPWTRKLVAEIKSRWAKLTSQSTRKKSEDSDSPDSDE